MTVELAVALLALLVALFALVALVAVHARVRALEAGRAVELSGYATLVGRPVPQSLRPRAGERGGVVAVLDADCALCHTVWDALRGLEDVRAVALVDHDEGFTAGGTAELLVDPDARADLFEGYSPTLLAVDASGTVTGRTFVYADTDLGAVLHAMQRRPNPTAREVTRA